MFSPWYVDTAEEEQRSMPRTRSAYHVIPLLWVLETDRSRSVVAQGWDRAGGQEEGLEQGGRRLEGWGGGLLLFSC